ncbi:MAG: bifunctional methylenetetrahydrofolate dehydrogenase/methenyltetrahydrofolate cyclohydrolase FolD [Deltaproteobacteria bacterium]|nr:bifunctional methylenetetrahydrofolate dehydrogenase/methenyltetrahydrofolate cyclohydrolase FolD [Deltaproteobacteria bacterium]
MATLIDGKAIAQAIRRDLSHKVADLQKGQRPVPGLAVIIVGNDAASRIYVNMKEKACAEAGFLSREYALPEETDENAVLRIVDELNADRAIHGILVQLPLPGRISADRVIDAIDPVKDVDGFHPYNVGRLFSGNPFHRSCTPAGIIELLDRSGISIEGKKAVIVGRSSIVGKPLAMMLLNRHATITVCHTRTRNLADETRQADILVAAAGRAEVIRGDMVKEGAVVIDVGVNRLENGKIVGDVNFDEAAARAGFITPVPGGVGPMTIAMLLSNTYNGAVRTIG